MGLPTRESSWHRSWRDTKHGWSDWRFLLLGAIVAPLAGFAVGNLTSDTSLGFLTTLGIVISGLVFVWIWATVRAPYRQRDEARAQVATVLDENGRLTEERIPKISAEACTGVNTSGIGAHLMWAELKVENTSPTQPLNGTQVRVVTCEHISPPLDGTDEYKNLGAYMWDWSPITLRWSQSDSDAKDIPGGTSRDVLVAFSDNSNGPPAVFNDVAHTHCPLELKILVEISSSSSAAWRGSYFIRCHPNYAGGPRAQFEFLAWEEWASTRTVIELDITGPNPDKADSQC